MENKARLTGLAKRLVQANLFAEEKAAGALEQSNRKHMHFVAYLVENKIATSEEIAKLGSLEFGAPLLDLSTIDMDAIPKELIKERLMTQHNALPLFKRGKRLYVAVSDPTNLQALDEFKFHSGLNTEAIIVHQDQLTQLIDKVINVTTSKFDGLEDTDLDNLDISSGDELEESEESGSNSDDAPIVRFINKILLDSINNNVSDIHFEPYEKKYRVRVRQDGMLREMAHPPANLASRLAARLKVMSRLDISEKRLPQDGRFKMKLSRNRAIDFRISTLPTLYGEKVVLRILDPNNAQLGIDALGYDPVQKEQFLTAIQKPQGMVLVTGPTGSGKTVSLYTALNILNTDEVNISTAEDPVEINVPGVNQVNVSHKAGLSFATALHSFLRQDPDIIMVGEIRDLETAEIAVKAAQTGHLVLSTLHTNSAAETLMRMINMGVPAFNLATSVILIIAQRLARRLCAHCKKTAILPKASLLEVGFLEAEIDSLVIYEPVGCEKCTQGYKGRVGIYEVLPISEQTAKIIMSGGSAIDIAAQAQAEGLLNLRQSGLQKIKEGVTSISEVMRVTKE